MSERARQGRVYLVGAGPGAPELLTLRARELIAAADVILYDRLIPAGALTHARAHAELIYVGKDGSAGKGASVPQERTVALMLERARAGMAVVRLKGGDPLLFGRGGEEAQELQSAGIPFEIVPGITAALGAGAYAGIPLTHRKLASALALITAHEDPAKDQGELDWGALARFPGTLVLYMGVRRLDAVVAALLAGGRAPEEPAALVEAATLPRQRIVRCSLAQLPEAAQRAAVRAPALTIIGPVAALADELGWRAVSELPLAGISVAVTRARAQASSLARRLVELGAEVIEAPAIAIRALEPRPLDPSPYDLICLTSANGVEPFFDCLAAAGCDARSLAHAQIAAIGPGTARALAMRGIRADLVPERFIAEGLLELIAGQGEQRLAGLRRALVARAREARATLPDGLRELGIQTDVRDLYETVAAQPDRALLEAAAGCDYITFTSASTVRNFLDALAGTGGPPTATLRARVVSIGPVTSAQLRERGLAVDVEARRHDIDGVVDALLADARASRAAAPGKGR
jgi:uroporphyrinogen III methyltransferase/synthase